MGAKHFILAVFLFLPLLFSSGCWDQQEIEDLAIVRAIAIDYLPNRRAPYLVTLAVRRPAGQGQQDGGGGGGNETIALYSGVGASIDLAIQQACSSIPRPVFIAHNELIIVGEEMAKRGVLPILDFVIRKPDVRLGILLLVAKGLGQEILHTPAHMKTSIDDEIMGLVQQANDTAITQPTEIFHFLRQMTTPGEDPHAAVIEVQPLLETEIPELTPKKAGGGEEKGGQDTGGGGTDPKKILALNGKAVFRGDRLAAILDHTKARGFLWLSGERTGGIIAVNDPVHPEQTVNLFILRSQTKISPQVQAGHISFRVEVEAEGYFMSQTSQADLTTVEMLAKLNSAKAGAIKEEMEKTLLELQKLEADIVGFGALLNRTEPKTFQQVAERWPEVFSRLPVEIQVKAHIRRTGMQSKPARINR